MIENGKFWKRRLKIWYQINMANDPDEQARRIVDQMAEIRRQAATAENIVAAEIGRVVLALVEEGDDVTVDAILARFRERVERAASTRGAVRKDLDIDRLSAEEEIRLLSRV